MALINRSKDCGNSPKNKLLEDVSIALATLNIQDLIDRVTEDVTWRIVGGETYSGTQELTGAMRSRHVQEVVAVTIDHVSSHGRTGSVSGHVKFATWSQEFCDVYEFSSASGRLVKSIKSYRIDEQP